MATFTSEANWPLRSLIVRPLLLLPNSKAIRIKITGKQHHEAERQLGTSTPQLAAHLGTEGERVLCARYPCAAPSIVSVVVISTLSARLGVAADQGQEGVLQPAPGYHPVDADPGVYECGHHLGRRGMPSMSTTSAPSVSGAGLTERTAGQGSAETACAAGR